MRTLDTGDLEIGMEVRAGDIFFTHSQTLLGKAIRYAQSDPGEENGVWANHTGVFIENGDALQVSVIEALWKTRKGPLQLKDTGLRVYRKVGLTELQKGAILHTLEKHVGNKYGWWKLTGHLFDRIAFKGKKVVSRLFFIDNRPICSYLAAHAFSNAGITFGMDPDAADPDEMMDYCETNPDRWEFIGELYVD